MHTLNVENDAIFTDTADTQSEQHKRLCMEMVAKVECTKSMQTQLYIYIRMENKWKKAAELTPLFEKPNHDVQLEGNGEVCSLARMCMKIRTVFT